eukprot:4154048-Prymnesium_polylepis.1
MKTSAPRLSSSRATARPMPVPPPDTIAVFPAKRSGLYTLAGGGIRCLPCEEVGPEYGGPRGRLPASARWEVCGGAWHHVALSALIRPMGAQANRVR